MTRTADKLVSIRYVYQDMFRTAIHKLAQPEIVESSYHTPLSVHERLCPYWRIFSSNKLLSQSNPIFFSMGYRSKKSDSHTTR